MQNVNPKLIEYVSKLEQVKSIVESDEDIEKLFNVQHFTNLIATTAKKHGLELITHI